VAVRRTYDPRVRATVQAWDAHPDHARTLDPAHVRAALTNAGGLVGLLHDADRSQRTKLYTALGITIDYQRDTATERMLVRSQLS